MNKQVFVERKKEEYKDDEELSKFLASNKSDEYKYYIIKHLEEDLSKRTYYESNREAIKQQKAKY